MSGWAARISRAARRPSSVLVGGMRMSTTATSGLWAPTLRIRSSASPAWPATSKPESSSRRVSPSRSSTESSAMTMRMLMAVLLGAETNARAGRSGEQLLQALARQLGLGDESAGPRAGDERAEVGRVATRDEDHDRSAAVARDARGDVEAVDVGQLHVE